MYRATACLCWRSDSISDVLSIRGADKVTGFWLCEAIEAETEGGKPPVFDVSMFLSQNYLLNQYGLVVNIIRLCY